MLAREIMNAPVTVRLGATLAEAADVLLAHRVSSASVLDDGNRLVGIVSDIDLISCEIEPDHRAHMRLLAPQAPPLPRAVDDVMTRDVLAMTPSTDVADIVAVMLAQHVPTIPIVEGDRVVGVVSRAGDPPVLAPRQLRPRSTCPAPPPEVG